MAKTPDYILKATKNYRDKHDIIQVRFPKGTREKIEKVADNVNGYIVSAVEEKLNGKKETTAQRTEKPVEVPKTDNSRIAQLTAEIERKKAESRKASVLTAEAEKTKTNDEIQRLINSAQENRDNND